MSEYQDLVSSNSMVSDCQELVGMSSLNLPNSIIFDSQADTLQVKSPILVKQYD